MTIEWKHTFNPNRPQSIKFPSGVEVWAIYDEDNLGSNDPVGLATQRCIKAYIDAKVGGIFKSYSFISRGSRAAAGTYYIAGYYNAPAADANLSQASQTVVLGTANIAYAAHAFLVAGGAGSASGGSGNVEVEVSGTSITDAGVRTTSDTEIIVANIASASLNQYFETDKKWLGQITFTLQNATGATQTTFSFDFNYGYCKYEDFGNRDFTVTDFEAVGLGGANDSSFNIRLFHHTSTGWTYAATGFVPGGTVLFDMSTIHLTEDQIGNGIPFAFKRAGLSQSINGAGSDGLVVEITTGTNNTIEDMNVHLGFSINV